MWEYWSKILKKVLVCNIAINFGFFTNNFVNSPRKGQKNRWKTVNFALENVFAILQKIVVWDFLAIGCRIEKKNIMASGNSNRIFKKASTKIPQRSHRLFLNWTANIFWNSVQNLKKYQKYVIGDIGRCLRAVFEKMN
jgi:hypothetical protein